MPRRKSQDVERKSQQSDDIPEPKEQDIMAAMQMLNSIAMAFSMQAGMMANQLKKLGCSITPSVYYPDKGNAIYMGFKLTLPSEKAAKYLNRCFELAAERMKKKIKLKNL